MIAVRDVAPAEEICDDYGIYYAPYEQPMNYRCGRPNCRGIISGEDLAGSVEPYDRKIQAALMNLNYVDQPLLRYLAPQTLEELLNFIETGTGFRSIALRQVR